MRYRKILDIAFGISQERVHSILTEDPTMKIRLAPLALSQLVVDQRHNMRIFAACLSKPFKGTPYFTSGICYHG